MPRWSSPTATWRAQLRDSPYGAFSNAGQVCVGTKRVYVEQPIYAKFIDELTARVGRLRVGSSSDADLGISPAEAARSNLASQIQDALDRGATLHSPPGQSLTGKIPVVLSNVSARMPA